MHYFLGVIVDEENPCIEYIESLMGPYDENLEIDEYEIECDCIGEVARCHANIVAGKYSNKRNSFIEIWYKEFNSHWLKDEPTKSCSCEGTGIAKSTDNSDGRWDWFVVGGRWNGLINGEPQEDKENIENNIISVKDYIKLLRKLKKGQQNHRTHTILFPNNWMEVHKLSISKLIKLLLPHKDQWVVGIDYHN